MSRLKRDRSYHVQTNHFSLDMKRTESILNYDVLVGEYSNGSMVLKGGHYDFLSRFQLGDGWLILDQVIDVSLYENVLTWDGMKSGK